MAIKIKQGDAYDLQVQVQLNGTAVNTADISEVEFMLGSLRKTYPGDVSYDATEAVFLLPITQTESFSFPVGALALDIRVKFTGGDVEGLDRPIQFAVVDAVSEVIL